MPPFPWCILLNIALAYITVVPWGVGFSKNQKQNIQYAKKQTSYYFNFNCMDKVDTKKVNN